MIKIYGLMFSLLLYVLPARAGDFIEWQTTNLQLLRGFEYELGPKKRTLVTLEHANRWKYGDFYFFTDLQWPDGGDFTFYAEITPRFSLSKISGKDLSGSLIKDVYLAANVEIPKTGSARYLVGPSVDWKIPGFTFLKTFLFYRDNPDIPGNTHQVTFVWNRTVDLGNVSLLLEGFADLAGNEGSSYAANELIVPRVLFDVGELFGQKKKKFFAGMEYTYWHNKFGVRGVTESAVQWQVKWVF